MRLSKGANPRFVIESQEARALRKAAKIERGVLDDDGDYVHRTDHMDALNWSEEMETHLSFVAAQS
jgi:hypothetical protein